MSVDSLENRTHETKLFDDQWIVLDEYEITDRVGLSRKNEDHRVEQGGSSLFQNNSIMEDDISVKRWLTLLNIKLSAATMVEMLVKLLTVLVRSKIRKKMLSIDALAGLELRDETHKRMITRQTPNMTPSSF